MGIINSASHLGQSVASNGFNSPEIKTLAPHFEHPTIFNGLLGVSSASELTARKRSTIDRSLSSLACHQLKSLKITNGIELTQSLPLLISALFCRNHGISKK
tara:strand:- start:979 stop:1284 length:306 start_codon:yes stop_codon:yes gene_type:complete